MAVSENSRNFAPVIPEKEREGNRGEDEEREKEGHKGEDEEREREKRHTAARKNNYMPFIGK